MNDLNLFTGKQLRDLGIKKAIDHAEEKTENWSGLAYGFLLTYCLSNKEFMAEDVRIASNGTIQVPPSKRAWGGVFMKAAKRKVIKRKGYRKVKNKNAHCTPATLWEVI